MGGREVECGWLVVSALAVALVLARLLAVGPVARARRRGRGVLRRVEGDLHRGDGLVGDRLRVAGEGHRGGLRLRVVAVVILVVLTVGVERRGGSDGVVRLRLVLVVI